MWRIKFAICYLNEESIEQYRPVVHSLLKNVAIVYNTDCTIIADHPKTSLYDLPAQDEEWYIHDIVSFQSRSGKAPSPISLADLVNQIYKGSFLPDYGIEIFQVRSIE